GGAPSAALLVVSSALPGAATRCRRRRGQGELMERGPPARSATPCERGGVYPVVPSANILREARKQQQEDMLVDSSDEGLSPAGLPRRLDSWHTRWIYEGTRQGEGMEKNNGEGKRERKKMPMA
ncbi:unnamed protein product, partial [Urochloa humidicola]